MDSLEQLVARRREILQQIEALGDMRKGSVTKQFLNVKSADGSTAQHGPYWVYTFKEQGRTVSRRLKSPGEVEAYKEQIKQFRVFEDLSAEFVEVNQKISDVRLLQSDNEPDKKKFTKSSPRKSRAKSKS